MTYFEKSNLGNLMKFFMYMVKFSAFPNKGALTRHKKVPSYIQQNVYTEKQLQENHSLDGLA